MPKSRQSRRSRPSKKSKPSQLSYSAKLKFARTYYKVSSGPLTPARKREITRKYNAAKAASTSTVQFKQLGRDDRDRLKRSGYNVTDKGAFIPARPGQKVKRVTKGWTHLTASTDTVNRTDFEFPLTPDDARAFLHNPRGFIRQLIADNPEIFDPLKGKRKRWELVFALGAQNLQRSIDELEEYLSQLVDEAEELEQSESIDKLESIERTLVAVRVTVFEGKKKPARR